MTRPWIVVDRVDTDEGVLELRRRGEGDFLITVGGRVLMNSYARRSEVALAELTCCLLGSAPAPTVLIGGLGMGCTLRAALDVLPGDARVVVAEITPDVARWCRGPLTTLNSGALADHRVQVRLEDVAETVRRAAEEGGTRFDAILFDLYQGPGADTLPDDPLYGGAMLDRVRAALRPGGVFAVWSESPCASFESRLRAAGYSVERSRPGRGGLRHVVYVARCRERSEPIGAAQRRTGAMP